MKKTLNNLKMYTINTIIIKNLKICKNIQKLITYDLNFLYLKQCLY